MTNTSCRTRLTVACLVSTLALASLFAVSGATIVHKSRHLSNALRFAANVRPRDISTPIAGGEAVFHVNLPDGWQNTLQAYSNSVQDVLNQNNLSQVATDVQNLTTTIQNSFADNNVTASEQDTIASELEQLSNDIQNATGLDFGAILTEAQNNPQGVVDILLALAASLGLSPSNLTIPQVPGNLPVNVPATSSANPSVTVSSVSAPDVTVPPWVNQLQSALNNNGLSNAANGLNTVITDLENLLNASTSDIFAALNQLLADLGIANPPSIPTSQGIPNFAIPHVTVPDVTVNV